MNEQNYTTHKCSLCPLGSYCPGTSRPQGTKKCSKEGYRKIWRTVRGKLLKSVQKARGLVDKYMEEKAA